MSKKLCFDYINCVLLTLFLCVNKPKNSLATYIQHCECRDDLDSSTLSTMDACTARRGFPYSAEPYPLQRQPN